MTHALDELHHETFTNRVFGFWLYLMTDCLLFTTLFCTFAVLRTEIFNGPSGKEIFNLNLVFAETMILLSSSVTAGFSLINASKSKKERTLFWLFLSFLLGIAFLGIELYEFRKLILEGNGFQKSAFLSSYFALVGTHGLHIFFGLLWAFVLMGQLIFFGIQIETFRRLTLFNLFWHFLDLVWIFIFTFVYLMGSL
ncbi:MAG TPA: cytochrome o ubiquinol oxidase subunit III [Parachlamydiaceae bacterium]|nr:cytochrome o ubiquinol oxidase subunit III [Parachlamydiaceae bacterium]